MSSTTVALNTKEKATLAFTDLKKKVNDAKEQATARALVVCTNLKNQAYETKEKTLVLVRDPQLQTCTLVTGGGAVALGTVGGAFGLASGIAVGSAAGLVPALFTFGLSIPVGAAVGGSVGACTGTLVGGASGGIAGFTTYKFRVQIKGGIITVQVKAQDSFNCTKEKAVAVLNSTKTALDIEACRIRTAVTKVATQVKQRSLAAVDTAKAKSADALTFATTTRTGVTSTSAVAGAVVGGTSGGATGTVVGAAVGVVPAIFTFGLSIPAGALVGLCVGTTVGASSGAVGGGLLGYGGFTHRKKISEGVHSSWSKVKTTADSVKAKTIACAADAKERVVRASTGGSEHDKSD